jgi:ketosteroid isomerase-like protein
MADRLSPSEILEKVRTATVENDPSVGTLYAEDAVFELPFAPAGVPNRIEGGAAIRAHLEKSVAASQARWSGFDINAVHEMADPDAIAAEYEVHGTIAATGQPFRMAALLLLRVHDGKIVLSRNYANPIATTEAHSYD